MWAKELRFVLSYEGSEKNQQERREQRLEAGIGLQQTFTQHQVHGRHCQREWGGER